MNYLIHARVVIVCKVHITFQQVLVTFQETFSFHAVSEAIISYRPSVCHSTYGLVGYKIFTVFTILIIVSLKNSIALTRVIKKYE